MNVDAKYTVYKFAKFVEKELGITKPYKLLLSEKRDDFTTFAYYNPANGLVAAYTKGRALPDVMRSVAHEMVHHFENQTGKLREKTNQDIGVYADDEFKTIDGEDIENRANSIAGALIKKFGYANQNLDIWANQSEDTE